MLNFGSEINTMTPGYASKLTFWVRHTNVKAQKINGSILETFKIVFASLHIKNKLEKACFFQKTFLLADFSVDVVLGIFFLIFSNENIQFAMKKLI